MLCLVSSGCMVSSTMSDWFSSLFSKRCIVWVMNVTDCLCVLWQGVSRWKNSLGNIFLIVIHFLMVILVVLKLIPLIPKYCVIIMEPPTGSFRQINTCLWVCIINLLLASIRIYISVWIIYHSLNSGIPFLCVYKAHSFSLTMEIIRRL